MLWSSRRDVGEDAVAGKAKTVVGAPADSSMAVAWFVALLALASVAFWPATGYGPRSVYEWYDQSFLLRAAMQTLELGLPDAETRTLAGPGYIALTLGLGWISGTPPAEALIFLSRLTFVVAAAILATVAIRYRAQASIGFQLALGAVAALVLASSVWFRFSDIPWTHFVAAALLGGMVLVSLTKLPLPARAALIGALAVGLMQTRLFEAMVAGIAAVMILPFVLVRYWQPLRAWPVSALLVALPFVAGAAVVFAAIGLRTNNWSIYQQYSDLHGMVLTPELAPTKVVQLFWDTCYATVCGITGSSVVSPLADTIDSWRQPLLLQLPGLIGAAAGLATLVVLRPRRALQLPLGVIFAMITSGGLVIAYTSGVPAGSPHLNYGFFRDFMPALMLLTTAFIGALATQRVDDGRTRPALVAALVVFFTVTIGLAGLRAVGLPQIPGAHVDRFEFASSCPDGSCTFTLRAIGPTGEVLPYNDLAYVMCAVDPSLPPVQRVSQMRVDAKACGWMTIVPAASGLLYAPQDDVLFDHPLDLSTPTDTVVFPSRD